MTEFLKNTLSRARVLASAYVTYAVIGVAVATAATGALEPFSGVPYVEDAIGVLGPLAAALAASVAIVRRVTEVPAEIRGVLLPADRIVDAVDDLEADDDFWSDDEAI